MRVCVCIFCRGHWTNSVVFQYANEIERITFTLCIAFVRNEFVVHRLVLFRCVTMQIYRVCVFFPLFFFYSLSFSLSLNKSVTEQQKIKLNQKLFRFNKFVRCCCIFFLFVPHWLNYTCSTVLRENCFILIIINLNLGLWQCKMKQKINFNIKISMKMNQIAEIRFGVEWN